MFSKSILTLLLLSSATVFAAPASSTTALTPGGVSTKAKAPTKAPSLVGEWLATGGMSGTITFRKNGSAVLAPDGFKPAEARWKAEGEWLHIIAEGRGRSVMHYEVLGDKLTLWYHQNGERQAFKRK